MTLGRTRPQGNKKRDDRVVIRLNEHKRIWYELQNLGCERELASKLAYDVVMGRISEEQAALIATV